VKIYDIEPLYYARDRGTGVAIAKAEDRPPVGSLVDFMQGHDIAKPGAIIPFAWDQLWDYRNDDPETPSLLLWPQFREWLADWPDEVEAFKKHWKRNFGMPGNDLADAIILVWEKA